MRVTKDMLEEQLVICRRERNEFAQENKVLKGKLSFLSSLMPHASMIIAMEKVTEALAHTISNLKRR